MPPGRVRLTSLVTLVNGEAMNLDTACKAMLGLLRRKGTEEAADMFTSSASKNTDYVLAGDEIGSKLEPVNSLGVFPALDETAFEELLS